VTGSLLFNVSNNYTKQINTICEKNSRVLLTLKQIIRVHIISTVFRGVQFENSVVIMFVAMYLVGDV
jgi:hypothetical protein